MYKMAERLESWPTNLSKFRNFFPFIGTHEGDCVTIDFVVLSRLAHVRSCLLTTYAGLLTHFLTMCTAHQF